MIKILSKEAQELVKMKRSEYMDTRIEKDKKRTIELSRYTMNLQYINHHIQHNFDDWFRFEKYFNPKNEPYKKYIKEGLFDVREGNFENMVYSITPKGQEYFTDSILKFYSRFLDQ